MTGVPPRYTRGNVTMSFSTSILEIVPVARLSMSRL